MLFLHLYVVLRMYVPLLLIYQSHVYVSSIPFPNTQVDPLYQSHIYVFSIPFPDTQVDHTIVRISARIILYIMLDHLGICRAIYRRRMYSQNKMSALCCSTLLSIAVGYVFCSARLPSNVCFLHCAATL